MVVAERRTRDFETPVFHERFGRVPASKIVFLRRKQKLRICIVKKVVAQTFRVLFDILVDADLAVDVPSLEELVDVACV